MECEVKGAGPRGGRGGLGERLWRRAVRRVGWTEGMPWVVGMERADGVTDGIGHSGCEWVDVSSGTSSDGLPQTKSREL